MQYNVHLCGGRCVVCTGLLLSHFKRIESNQVYNTARLKQQVCYALNIVQYESLFALYKGPPPLGKCCACICVILGLVLDDNDIIPNTPDNRNSSPSPRDAVYLRLAPRALPTATTESTITNDFVKLLIFEEYYIGVMAGVFPVSMDYLELLYKIKLRYQFGDDVDRSKLVQDKEFMSHYIPLQHRKHHKHRDWIKRICSVDCTNCDYSKFLDALFKHPEFSATKHFSSHMFGLDDYHVISVNDSGLYVISIDIDSSVVPHRHYCTKPSWITSCAHYIHELMIIDVDHNHVVPNPMGVVREYLSGISSMNELRLCTNAMRHEDCADSLSVILDLYRKSTGTDRASVLTMFMKCVVDRAQVLQVPLVGLVDDVDLLVPGLESSNDNVRVMAQRVLCVIGDNLPSPSDAFVKSVDTEFLDVLKIMCLKLTKLPQSYSMDNVKDACRHCASDLYTTLVIRPDSACTCTPEVMTGLRNSVIEHIKQYEMGIIRSTLIKYLDEKSSDEICQCLVSALVTCWTTHAKTWISNCPNDKYIVSVYRHMCTVARDVIAHDFNYALGLLVQPAEFLESLRRFVDKSADTLRITVKNADKLHDPYEKVTEWLSLFYAQLDSLNEIDFAGQEFKRDLAKTLTNAMGDALSTWCDDLLKSSVDDAKQDGLPDLTRLKINLNYSKLSNVSHVKMLANSSGVCLIRLLQRIKAIDKIVTEQHHLNDMTEEYVHKHNVIDPNDVYVVVLPFDPCNVIDLIENYRNFLDCLMSIMCDRLVYSQINIVYDIARRSEVEKIFEKWCTSLNSLDTVCMCRQTHCLMMQVGCDGTLTPPVNYIEMFRKYSKLVKDQISLIANNLQGCACLDAIYKMFWHRMMTMLGALYARSSQETQNRLLFGREILRDCVLGPVNVHVDAEK